MPARSSRAEAGAIVGGALLGAGGTVTAAAAAICCAGPAIGPLIVGILGAGGAAALAGLRPYSIALLALSGLVIGYSLWRATRVASACAPGARPRSVAVARAILWAAFAVWVASAATVVYTFFAA